MNDANRPKSNQRGKPINIEGFEDTRIPIPTNLQPTPINRDKIVPVERVSIQATRWTNLLDTKSIEYLKGLGPSKKESKATATTASRPHQKLHYPKELPSTPNKEHAISSLPTSVTFVTYNNTDPTLLRPKQVDQWYTRFAELVEFRKNHGHCLVPLRYKPNRSLSNWVKRQRYQYRIKQEGKHSTLNDERQAALEQLGFVWDSHSSTWEERFQELSEFKVKHGHSNVPKSYKENQQLAIWVKSQRRHFRMHLQGKPSALTEERKQRLQSLDFVFNPRSICIKGEAEET